MGPYKSIAVGGLTEHSEHYRYWWYDRHQALPMTAQLEEALIATNRFEVLDRAHLDKVLGEQRLSATDLADQGAVSKLGKVITAGAFVFGDVGYTYREVPKSEKCTDLLDSKKQHVCRSLTGESSLTATFKIVDVTTGRLVITKTLHEKRTHTNEAMDSRPDPIDRPALEQEARSAVVARFMKAIVPHQEYAEAKFKKDGDIPQLESGIGWAQHGEWQKAQETFSALVQSSEKNANLKAPQIAKCYWDLGLSYEYAGDYEKAIETINKAYALSNDADMLSEIASVKRLRSDAEKVARQGGMEVVAGEK
jgi:tetratricopeptide (TPR) repeat protein